MAEVNGRPFLNTISLGVSELLVTDDLSRRHTSPLLDLMPPLQCTTRRAALRVRISRHHPGASPAALLSSR